MKGVCGGVSDDCCCYYPCLLRSSFHNYLLQLPNVGRSMTSASFSLPAAYISRSETVRLCLCIFAALCLCSSDYLCTPLCLCICLPARLSDYACLYACLGLTAFLSAYLSLSV